MADKARMRDRGELGAYLLGHSPVDRSLLKLLGMTTEEWVVLVRSTATDEEIWTALVARGIDEDALHRWTAAFEETFAMYIPLWDVGEGYRRPTLRQWVRLQIMNRIEGRVMERYRRDHPAP